MYLNPSFVAAAVLCLAPGTLGRDRLGLRGRKPAMVQKREEEVKARAFSDINLRATSSSNSNSDKSSYRYYNNQTARVFLPLYILDPPGIDGTHVLAFFVESLPDVPFSLGEVYSGLIPIDYSNTSEALFFFFQPTVGEPVNEVTIWLNGGPGCSSLEGFFQENGLYTWQPGTYQPVLNPYSWVNLTNMLW